MKAKTLCSLLLTSCCFVIANVSLPTVNAGGQGKHDQEKRSAKEVYTGSAVAIGGQFGGNSRTFTLEITGHTPDAQVQQDLQILQDGGQDALMKSIGEDKLGFFSFEGQIGRDLNFVQETNTEDGRKIIVLFERWLKMFEVRNGTRSEDYPFTYIELYIKDNDKGEGSLIGAAKVYIDKRHPSALDIENFATYPAKLTGVELRK